MTTGVTFAANRGQTFRRRGQNSHRGVRFMTTVAVLTLPWHSPKSKQGISATPNVPESLVFSGFPDILFIPFVSNKRFTSP